MISAISSHCSQSSHERWRRACGTIRGESEDNRRGTLIAGEVVINFEEKRPIMFPRVVAEETLAAERMRLMNSS